MVKDRKDLNDENVCFTGQNPSKGRLVRVLPGRFYQQLGPLNSSTKSSMGLLSLFMCIVPYNETMAAFLPHTLRWSMGWRSKKRMSGPVYNV